MRLNCKLHNKIHFFFLRNKKSCLFISIIVIHLDIALVLLKKQRTTITITLRMETPTMETPAVEATTMETPAVETATMETTAMETTAMETTAMETTTMETPTTPSTVAGKRRRGEGKRLNDIQRLEIIHKCNAGLGFRAAGREYSVSDSAIRKLLKNQDSVTERTKTSSEAVRASIKRCGQAKFPKLESKLLQWITTQTTPVQPVIVKMKAEQIAFAMGLSNKDFRASDGWHFRFKKRQDMGLM